MVRSITWCGSITLDELGPRICIMGPSNSGKSTLAAAIGPARGLTPVHLDQLFHRPGTNWQPRPEAEFVALHDREILRERWIMEGNYSRCLPRRLERATGLILLDASTVTSLHRYVRRSWFRRDRPGDLAGARDRVRWTMIRHIAVATRRDRCGYATMFEALSLPKIRLATPSQLARFYRSERLER